MENNNYQLINLVKKNSFETLNVNLSFKNGECVPLVKIGKHIKKGDLIAGGNNRPNVYSPINSVVKDIKKIRIGKNNLVSTHIELNRELTENIKRNQKIKEIQNPLSFLFHIEGKGVIDCQENCDIFEELHKKIEKAEKLILNFYDTDEFTYTYKYLFKNKINENVEIIIYLNKIFNFKNIIIIYDKQCEDVIERYNELFNKNNMEMVTFISIKNNLEYDTKLKLKLNSIKLTTKSLIKKRVLYFDCKTLNDIFIACKQDNEITSTLFTLGGDAIENIGIYKMPIGVSIREIIEIAKTKNSYDYVDSFVYNAMEAHNDKIEFEKEIESETDESKKQELIALMEKKNKEAEESIFSKMEETREYYNQCLGLIYEVQGHNQSGIYSQENVITPATSALIMITRNTLKKLK